MKYFVVALHFYQPPTQDLAITQQILESCYLPLLRMLNEKKNFKITFNLSGSLLEQLEKLHATEFFELTKKLIDDGKVQLVSSIMYHSLLPLINSDTFERGVRKNSRIIERLISTKTPVGFFPPELAVDEKSLDSFQNTVLFVSEDAVTKHSPSSIPIFSYKTNTLLIGNKKIINLFRAYPKKLDIQKVFSFINKEFPKESLFILPNDSELFGHHYSERLKLLADLLDSSEVAFLSIKEAVAQFGKDMPVIRKINLSSWQNTNELDLWTKNTLQKKYLKLAKLATELTKKEESKEVFHYLDKGWSSCYFYWLSNWPWWYPDIVESGAKNLIKSVRSCAHLSYEEKTRAEKLYFSLLSEIWQYHWSGEVEKNYELYEKALNASKNRGV